MTNMERLVFALLMVFGNGVTTAGDVEVLNTFEGDRGPGFKAAANVMGSVGPNHVVDFTIAGFTVRDKTSGKVLRHQSQLDFWRQVQPVMSLDPSPEANDPWMVYDPLSERWFATIAGTGTGESYLAVSSSANPMQPWKGVSLPLPRVDPGLKIGVDRNGVYISCANGSENSQEALDLYVIPKADAIDPGGPVLVDAETFTKLIYAAFPALHVEADQTVETPAVLINNEFGGLTCGELYLYRIAWREGRAAISEKQTIPLSRAYAVPRMEGVQPEGGVRLVQAGGRRNNSAFVYGGSVFSCNGAQRTADSRPGILWYEVRIEDGALLQEGFVDSPDFDYLYPSIAVDSRGNIGIGCTRTSETEYPSVCVMMHRAGDPAGTMQPPVVAVKGSTIYHYAGTTAMNFSNYSTTCIDPTDSEVLWTYQGYANSSVDRQWCTAWAAFRLLETRAANDCNAPPQEIAAPAPAIQVNFAGQRTVWHGFDRFDFLMNEETLDVTPIKASPDEGDGINGEVEGHLCCVLVVPKDAAPGKPWSWRGRYFDHEPQAEIELLNRGFHIGFIQSDVGKPWEAWYRFLTESRGLARKPSFIGMSGGGRNAFTWATTHPDKVSCLYVDNPLITRESLMRLGDLAQRDVPLLHICGSLDPLTVNHTLPVESIYQQLGGRISVMIKDGAGHHPHSLRDPTLIADFIVRSFEHASGDSPAFAGEKFTRSAFYGSENSYRDFPSESTYITCRGPLFSDSFNRYEFKPDSITGTIAVIEPKAAAIGKPWVLRADFVPRDALIDLALLQHGFHIVTAPRPRDTNVTVLQEWNATYDYLINHGFSTKPVLEGAGRAAGEVYAWAIANPDKVSCIYAENPVLRSTMSEMEPLDHLAPLAKAGVQLLHVCGSLDPWLKGQTRVAEKRYQELGGTITVMINEGVGHYPLAPKELQPAVDFILRQVAADSR